MPEYKLIYFNIRGRAEVTRWIFAYAGIPYVDERIEKEKWPAVKKTVSYGKLPCLMVDGTLLAQSHAISRFVAREAGLVPQDKLQVAQCDAVVDTMNDFTIELYKIHQMPENEERMKAYEELKVKTLYPALNHFQNRLKEHDWIVGDKITWADLTLGYCFGEILQRRPNFLEDFPAVAEHAKKVRNLPKIKEWIANSPKTAY